ncbi:MAG: hypothetical protein ACRCX7_11240 [Cetobacterium sp.]|uniref:hypothetical protein n=1 Tax=Cetobacterium sp. TaxID=2071632 RepID=UPI003F2C2E6B
MISKNFLTGLGAIVGIAVACIAVLVIGFYVMGPLFVFVLFIMGALSSIIGMNYDEIEYFGKSIRKVLEERNGN